MEYKEYMYHSWLYIWIKKCNYQCSKMYWTFFKQQNSFITSSTSSTTHKFHFIDKLFNKIDPERTQLWNVVRKILDFVNKILLKAYFNKSNDCEFEKLFLFLNWKYFFYLFFVIFYGNFVGNRTCQENQLILNMQYYYH